MGRGVATRPIVCVEFLGGWACCAAAKARGPPLQAFPARQGGQPAATVWQYLPVCATAVGPMVCSELHITRPRTPRRCATRSGRPRTAAPPSCRCWPWPAASAASSRSRRRRAGTARPPPQGWLRRHARQQVQARRRRRQPSRSRTLGCASGSRRPRPLACWVRPGWSAVAWMQAADCQEHSCARLPAATPSLCASGAPCWRRSRPAAWPTGAATGPLLRPHCRGGAV